VINNQEKIRVSALQLKPKIGDIETNLTVCENMVNEAGKKGAKWIILPEFFTTGMAFNPRIVEAIQPPNGKALHLLLQLAKRYQAYVGGSFIVRDEDGEVRNAFFLASPRGIVGRHDKDIPTMWENCFYIGGEDDGIINIDKQTAGVSLCWEFMRSQTAKRLRERVDLVVGGSCWWSIPPWIPKRMTRYWEKKNEETALHSVQAFARYVGAPIIHAAHVGPVQCQLPWMPIRYKGYYEAGSMIVDNSGHIVALRDRHQGRGVVIADIKIGQTKPTKEIPNKYWLHKRGPIPALAWVYQRCHGKQWYKKNVKYTQH